MNRRSGDRRRGERSSFTKAHLIMTTMTLIVSLISLLVSLNTRTAVVTAASMTNEISVDQKSVESAEVQPRSEEKPSVQVQKARPKVESKRSHSRERVGKIPKRVRVIFEESVARAPASVPPAEQGTKTIKYSNDLYEKEDLL